jgi:hypothetical protein
MKTKEILEGNKLIAEFMGDFELVDEFKPQPDIDVTYCWKKLNNKSFGYDTTDWRDYSTDTDYSNQVCYHFSWDWLMPVVGEVSILHDQHTYFHVGHVFDELKDALYDADIKKTYQAVVKSIQWYNKNK